MDKSVKVFNVGDEFLVHTFKAHLTASILTALDLSSTSDLIDHTTSKEWLQDTAEKLVTKRHWKWWLPRFLGTGRKNYGAECVYHMATLSADFPKHTAYIATHNRTVNMYGHPGRGKPVEQLNEHYNL